MPLGNSSLAREYQPELSNLIQRCDKMLAATLLIPYLLFTGQASAATWYFLRYYTPSGAKFTSFSGEMVIPALPQAGTYYLWPGLQPTDNTGVYQNVLDGRSGTWWIGSGWCCSNPSLPVSISPREPLSRPQDCVLPYEVCVCVCMCIKSTPTSHIILQI